MTAELPDEIKEKFPEKLTEALQNLLKNPEYLSMLISGITQPDRNRIMQWMNKMYQQKKYVKGWMLKKADEYFSENPFNEVNAKAVAYAVPIAIKTGKFPVDKVREDRDFYDFLKSLDLMQGAL